MGTDQQKKTTKEKEKEGKKYIYTEKRIIEKERIKPVVPIKKKLQQILGKKGKKGKRERKKPEICRLTRK